MAYEYKEWVTDNLERAKPSVGDEWTATCPSCGKYGGFYVNTNAEGDGPFVCFKCDFSGKHFARLVAEVEGCTYTEALQHMYKDAVTFRRKETVESLAERIKALRGRDVIVDADVWDDMESAKMDFALPPSMFKPIWDGKRWRVPEYLTERGFQREALRDWGVGFCAKGSWAAPGARPQWWGGRVIIPFECPNGRSFTGRDLTGDQEPKYLNPTGADHAQLLIGWDHVRAGADFALVEGPLDALRLYQWGIPALAYGGKHTLSPAQLNMLFKYPESASVTVMLDPDALANAYAVAKQLKLRFNHVYVARIPATDKAGRKLDPGASTRKQAHKWYDGAPEYTGERGVGALARVREALAKSQSRFKK